MKMLTWQSKITLCFFGSLIVSVIGHQASAARSFKSWFETPDMISVRESREISKNPNGPVIFRKCQNTAYFGNESSQLPKPEHALVSGVATTRSWNTRKNYPRIELFIVFFLCFSSFFSWQIAAFLISCKKMMQRGVSGRGLEKMAGKICWVTLNSSRFQP